MSALRSGTYSPRSNGLLHATDGSWDALGVLCDVMPNREEWVARPNFGIYTLYGCASTLPAKIVRWSGLRIHEQAMVWTISDTYQWDFARTADWIQENL